MKVTCNECNNSFEIKCKNIIINDIETMYFRCTECNQLYIISCVNDYIRKEQQRYKRLNNKTLKKICHNNIMLHSNMLKKKLEKSNAFKDM